MYGGIPSSICYSRRCTRTRAVCVHTMLRAVTRTYPYMRVRARIHYRISPVVQDGTQDARAPFALACLARKSRVHALLRARVCLVCVCRVLQRTERWTREKELQEIHTVSFWDDTHCNLLVIPLEKTVEDSVRYRPRSYANKLRGALYREADRRASRLHGITLFSWSSERMEPVSLRVRRLDVKRNTTV